jgi:hypothetical protein
MFLMHCFRELGKKLCLALASMCLLCCVTLAQTVETTYAPGFNFSKYRTYKWVPLKGPHPDPSVDAQIKQSIDSQLAAKGLTRKDDAADLNIDYQTAISQQEKWQAYEDWTQTGLMYERIPQRKLVVINTGTLVIDMYDTAAKQLVWTGRAEKTLDPKSSQKDRQKSIDKATKKMLSFFPPK